MSFLFRKEQEDAALSHTAKSVIFAMRSGLTEEEAASQNGVSQVELHKWRKSAVYRAALAAGLAAGEYEPVKDVVKIAAEIRADDEPDIATELREEALGESCAALRRQP